MANLSDADVTIHVEKVGKEFINYINKTNETPTDYAIVYESYPESEVDKDGNVEIHSSSSGRWAYSNNLEGYFNAERVKSWLGVDSNYTWLSDEAKKKEYKVRSNEQYDAYLGLIEALKKTGGRVEISYTDCDAAMDWMCTGGATLEVENGEVVFLQSDESEDLTIAGYAEMQDETELWALEYLHGDEVAEAYDDYRKQCKLGSTKPSSPDDWYDNEYEQE